MPVSPEQTNQISVYAHPFGWLPGAVLFRRPVRSGGTAGNTTLKFIHCDFIESGKEIVLMIIERGCGLARYGDGLQRSLRSLCFADDEQWVY